MVRCPLCNERIQAVTPWEKKTGRFFIECPECDRNICLSLEKEKITHEVGVSQALVTVKEEKRMESMRKGLEEKKRITELSRKRIPRQRRIKSFRKAPPMETAPERFAVVMELEDDSLECIEKVDEEEVMEKTGSYGDQVESKREKERKDERVVRRYKSLSASLFFMTFVLGIVSLFTMPLYSPVTVNPNENYNGEYVDIMGTVYDGNENGSVINNAIVVIKGSNRRTNTDDFGYFFFEDVEEGTYSITATKKGFGTETKVITVSGNSADSVVNFQLDMNDRDGDETFSSPQKNDDEEFNPYFSIVLFSSLCALAAGVFALFSNRLYPTVILGLFGIASVGYVIGSLCAFVGMIFHIFSKREF